MEPSPRTAVQVAASVVLLLGALGLWAWFLSMPDFHNALEGGLDRVLHRNATSTLVFFGVPALGTVQAGLAAALFYGIGGRVVVVVAWGLCALDVLGLVGAVALFVALDSFHMH
jgi:hypothetical protein